MNGKLFWVIGLLLVATVVAAAETRTWTFEKSGKTVRGEVVGFDGNSVILKLPEGKTFSVVISYLIESDRDHLSAKRKQADEDAADRARDRMSWSYETRLFKGTVLQKLPEGLLVSSGEDNLAKVGVMEYWPAIPIPNAVGIGERSRYNPYVAEGDAPGATCLGLIFLVDFPDYSKVVDGDKIEVMGHRVGTHSYTTAQGSMKTVRRFTASISNFEQRMAKQKPERKHINETKSTSDSYNYEGPSITIAGKVLQKLPNGLLVDSGIYEMPYEPNDKGEYVYHGKSSFIHNTPNQFEESMRRTRPRAVHVGLVLLVDFPKYPDVVDDDLIRALAYPVGEYSYTTAQDARKTVRRFSAKPP